MVVNNIFYYIDFDTLILMYLFILMLFSFTRYHIPRSFFKHGENTLVLFEEFGGNPSKVQFQTVEIGKVCLNAYEGHTVELSCKDRSISRIEFASFSTPQDEYGSFDKNVCESNEDVISIIEQ